MVFYNEVETTTGHKVKILRTDGGLEFCNSDFKTFLGSRGILLHTSAPYRPEQNNRIERENRTIVESVRTMLHARDIPRFLWAEAVQTAVYALNSSLYSIVIVLSLPTVRTSNRRIKCGTTGSLA